MRRWIIAITAAASALAGAHQPGLLPAIQSRGDLLVLAKVVDIQDSPDGAETHPGSQQPSDPRKWKAVILETMDVLIGQADKRIAVAVPANEVKFSNDFADGRIAGLGGRGPKNGLVIGDVSVWAVQRGDTKGRFINEWAYIDLRVNDPLRTLTAPGRAFMWAADPLLIDGRLLASGVVMHSPLAYDHALSGPLRYADIVGAAVSSSYRDGKNPSAQRDALSELVSLKDTFTNTYTDSGRSIEAAPEADVLNWFQHKIVETWPTDGVGHLNITAVRMFWEKPEPLEADFVEQIGKLGRSSLLIDLPPVKSPAFFIDEVAESEPGYVAEAFRHLREFKTKDARISKAAVKWLDTLMGGGKAAAEARSCGLDSGILWWLADTTGQSDITKNWNHPTHETLMRARALAENPPKP